MNVIGSCFQFFIHFVLALFSIQFVWQLIIVAIKYFYLWWWSDRIEKLRLQNEESDRNRNERIPLGIPYIRFLSQLLGLTGLL